ncbi:MAG: GAF domain-containing protein [Pelagibacteraceae bacterium]|nr:GAF domain-containing protein [Pelagibacteraceae bacterium]
MDLIISNLLKKLVLIKDPEKALMLISYTAYQNVGFRKNNNKKFLKHSEKDQYACGFFLILNKTKQILIAPQNYGAEQNYLIIKTNLGHPAWVIKNKQSLLLKNTDDHKSFVKILATFKAGSVVYSPMVSGNRFIGQIICASQARNVMNEDSLNFLNILANIATLQWTKKNGDKRLKLLRKKFNSH